MTSPLWFLDRLWITVNVPEDVINADTLADSVFELDHVLDVEMEIDSKSDSLQLYITLNVDDINDGMDYPTDTMSYRVSVTTSRIRQLVKAHQKPYIAPEEAFSE